MTKDLGSLQPLNEEKFFEEFDSLEEDARKEKIQSVLKERNDVLDYNRKLFSRAKEAEGFEQDDEGNWIKVVKEKSKAKDSVKPDEKLLERLDNLALKVSNITAEDEKELFSKWKDQTGREADEIIGNKIFQAELSDLRTVKANAKATDKVKGESGGSDLTSDPQYWIDKATKGPDGKLMFPEDLPEDHKLRAAIAEKLISKSKGKAEFYFE